MSEAVQQLEALLHDQPQAPLRPRQMVEYRDEMDRLEGIANAPAWQGGDRGAARIRYNHVKRIVAEQAPKPLDPIRRDQVAKLSQEVMDTVIRPAMLPRSEMRRNPAGAVDLFLRRENAPAIKKAIKHWKRARFAIEPDTDRSDWANIEPFRPEGMPAGVSTFMADAQIPGVFAMSPQAKDNWPLGDPTAATALAQVQQREKKPHWTQKLSPEARAELAAKMRAHRDPNIEKADTPAEEA